MPVKLHAHQEVAVDSMHNGCVLYGGVGTGKSITAMAYFVSKVCGGEYGKPGTMKKPKDVYVITTAKKRDSLDWELEAARFGIFGDTRKSMENIKITVDSWNNIKDYTDVKDAFFIFDEQRVVGYGAWSRAFIKIARDNEWVLLSATPGDTWLDYIPVFIANGWYRNKTDFIDQHVIWTPRVKYPKVLRYQNVGKLVRRRNEVLVHMPYERHTVRHSVDVWCDYDQDAFNKVVNKKWHVFENRPLRDVAELFSVMRKVANSNDSRLVALRGLLEKHPKIIVFYNFDYELEMLRTLVPEDQLASPESIRDLKRKLDTTPVPAKERTPTSVSPKDATEKPASNSLVGTIWEDGFDETDPKTWGNPEEPLTSSSNGSRSGSTSNSPHGRKSTYGTGGSVEKKERTESWSSKSPSSRVRCDTSTSESTPTSGGSSDGMGTEQSSSESLTPKTESSRSTTSLPSTVGEFAIAEWNGHKHEPIPATERWLYLVQYRAGAEGWNCIDTDAIVFWSQTYSYRDWWQAHGRIDRLNTPFTNLYYYHFISKSVIDKAIRKALKMKKSFNERDLDLGKAT